MTAAVFIGFHSLFYCKFVKISSLFYKYITKFAFHNKKIKIFLVF